MTMSPNPSSLSPAMVRRAIFSSVLGNGLEWCR